MAHCCGHASSSIDYRDVALGLFLIYPPNVLKRSPSMYDIARVRFVFLSVSFFRIKEREKIGPFGP